MATKVFNMEGGLHSAAAYSAFENRAYGSCVASTDSFVVSAGIGMNARISPGDGLIDTGLGFARRIQSDAQETVSVEPASTSYNRIDTVVAYIDTSVTPTTSVVDNTNGILKFAAVAGTAAASPQAPTQAAIQAAIGAGNPYMPLYNITVPSNATSLMGAVLADQRKNISIVDVNNIPDRSLGGQKIKKSTIKPENIDKDSFILESSQTTASIPVSATAYTVHANSPSITLPITPKRLRVDICGVDMWNTGTGITHASLSVSGSNTVTPADKDSIRIQGTQQSTPTGSWVFDNLNSGPTTFKIATRVNKDSGNLGVGTRLIVQEV